MPTKTKQDPEIQVILAAIPALKDGRWLISFDHEGKIHTKPVPPDACVMTKKEMLEAINKGMVLDTNMLAEFAIATVNNLKSRCDYVNSLRPVNEV
ncbi:hypothetical protein [Nitrosomonas sp. Nm166]|uniref:hypothetical protein n=1 Tax=Nitrosomonas sp. Nm166 TaxID=1881054 RepID=UPI0008EED57B|nr:hypothetical protein [Nitrosomonas sp. Nm166]SFF12568.1 hypothetical protein SAMN05428977_105313 [Nitrosomonas sp. Nm166]